MKVAYADPPYVGQAKRHYGHEPEYAGEVDHEALIARLMSEYPDGWALSASSSSLRYVLSLCPEDVRVAAWVKPFASYKPNVNPGYTWEPVIFTGGRSRTREALTVKDHHIENITMRKGLHGAKPLGFCIWVLDLLGVTPEDTVDDLYPGTGAMGAAVEMLNGRMVMG